MAGRHQPTNGADSASALAAADIAAIMACKHQTYGDGHCADNVCRNYYGKCARHAASGQPEYPCSREPAVAP